MNVNNNCFLSFHSHNNTDDSDIKIATVAEYKYTGDKQSVTFEETDGEFGRCKTTVTVDEDRVVTVERDGPYAAYISAQKNKRNISQHTTPFGSFSLGIKLKHFNSTLGETGGALTFGYVADSDFSIISDIDFRLKIKLKNKSNNPLTL